jgi:hypothetical protein
MATEPIPRHLMCLQRSAATVLYNPAFCPPMLFGLLALDKK